MSDCKGVASNAGSCERLNERHDCSEGYIILASVCYSGCDALTGPLGGVNSTSSPTSKGLDDRMMSPYTMQYIFP
jgi:hypothetical protein